MSNKSEHQRSWHLLAQVGRTVILRLPQRTVFIILSLVSFARLKFAVTKTIKEAVYKKILIHHLSFKTRPAFLNGSNVPVPEVSMQT